MSDAAMPESGAEAPAPAGTLTPVGGREDFSARLESFQGPLDLLLYLIKENEVDIVNIPIHQILEQFLKYLDAALEWDLHLAGEFLVMAATLMEIKSRELLPVQETVEGEEIIEDPRSELVRQLLRYRRLKEQARALEEQLERWEHSHPRGCFDEIPELPPEETPAEEMELDFDLYDLLTAFERVQKSVLAATPRRVGYEGETVEEAIDRIERVLKERPYSRFVELVAHARSRPDIATCFVALLELVRRRMIRLVQAGEAAGIEVKVQSPEEAEALAREESLRADEVQTIAEREKAERAAQLAEEAAALGVSVEELPWKTRRTLLAKKKFEGVVRPEDLEEIDAEEGEIGRRIDAIFAAVDAITQRFEGQRPGEEGIPPLEPLPDESDAAPLSMDDLAPTPEAAPQAQDSPESQAETPLPEAATTDPTESAETPAQPQAESDAEQPPEAPAPH
ncbi:MAG: segregation/condensation protein A [Planctomycetes bacterium]|nr:segregation/condensation protein A [Planctomycetota bacterium]